MPRVTGAAPITASARRKPTRALVVSMASRCGGQKGAGGPPVDVVGVAHSIGGVTDVLGGAQDGVDRAEGRFLEGEAHVDVFGPGVLDVVADRRSCGRAQHEHDGPEAGGERIAGDQVDDRLAPRTDGGQRFDASIAAGSTGSQDDERQSGRRRGVTGPSAGQRWPMSCPHRSQ